jgi:hypothetical protein
MKKADLYEVAIKIAGLYFFYTTIEFLYEMIKTILFYYQTGVEASAFYGKEQLHTVMLLTISQFMIMLAFTLLLLINTKKIARIICTAEDYSESLSLNLEKKSVFEIALVIMGLTIIVWTLPDFCIRLKNHIELVQNDMATNYFDTTFTLTSGLKLVVAFVSLFFSRPLSVFLAGPAKDNNRKLKTEN